MGDTIPLLERHRQDDDQTDTGHKTRYDRMRYLTDEFAQLHDTEQHLRQTAQDDDGECRCRSLLRILRIQCRLVSEHGCHDDSHRSGGAGARRYAKARAKGKATTAAVKPP